MSLADPTISFIVPTHSHQRPIKRCLDSIVDQIGPNDEVLVIGDTTDGELPEVETLVASYDKRFRYLFYKGLTHVWGHDQINAGMAAAMGNFLSFQDDDDIWTPGCVESIRDALRLAPDKVHLFRFLSYFGYPVWQKRGLFRQGFVGGHCVICPNNSDKRATWSIRYEGDWDFVEETVRLNGGESCLIWHEEIIAVARPPE